MTKSVEAIPVQPAPTRLIIALALAAALAPLGSTMVAVALPAIGRDFGVDAGTLTQWIVNSYLLIGIMGQSPGGKMGDLFGHRRALAAGQLMFAFGTVLGFMAPRLWVLVLARVAMAAGGAVMAPSAIAMLRNSLSEERRGRAFGAFGALMALAAATGPMLGGELTTRFGWRAIFVANVPMLASSALLAASTVQEPRQTTAGPPPRFDFAGSALLGISLLLFVLGLKVQGIVAIVMLVVAAIGFVAFYRWELRCPNPVIDPSLFRRRGFAAGSLVVALQNLAMYAMLFQLPYFFVHVRHSDSSRMGRSLFAMMLMMVIFAPIGGRLTERLGARMTAGVGSVIALSGMVLLDLRAMHIPSDARPFLMLLGIGLGLCSAPTQSAAMGAADRARSGMAAGVMSTMRYLGGVIGIAVLGKMLGGGDSEAAVIEHQHATWVFATALAFAAVATAGLPGRITKPAG